MATPIQTSRPSPERVFNTLNAFQQTAALKAGIELDIFTAIADGANTTALLAEKTGAAERGVRILCDYLTIHEFLAKNNGRYSLSQESAIFLNRHSPAYMGTLADFLASAEPKRNFDALTESVRKGGTSVAQGDNTKPNDELWVTFARTMAPLTTVSAGFIADLALAKVTQSSSFGLVLSPCATEVPPFLTDSVSASKFLLGSALARKSAKVPIYAGECRLRKMADSCERE